MYLHTPVCVCIYIHYLEAVFFGHSGFNFINVKRMNFCTKVIFSNFFYLHLTREKLEKSAEKMLVRKMRTGNVDEIDTWVRARSQLGLKFSVVVS